MQALKQDLVDRAKDEYNGKTIMICWEHKNMCASLIFLMPQSACVILSELDTHKLLLFCSPYIAAKFGLTTQELDWGLNPLSGVCIPRSHVQD